MSLAAILPVLQIMWFNRSWIFKYVPRCEVKAEEGLVIKSNQQDDELKAQVNELLEQANLLMEQAQAIQKKIKNWINSILDAKY